MVLSSGEKLNILVNKRLSQGKMRSKLEKMLERAEINELEQIFDPYNSGSIKGSVIILKCTHIL